MNEVWPRLGIVVAALIVALFVVMALRRRSGPSSASVAADGLLPGVYLFTSSACTDCTAARDRLESMLGPSGYVEIEWESEPDLFHDLGIEVVPYTVVVAGDGSATRHPGMPGPALGG
jgi:hypothetical protein